MKSCNEKSKLATVKHTHKIGKTEKTNHKLTQQTLLTKCHRGLLILKWGLL